MKLVYIDESEKAEVLYLFGGLVVDENQCRNISERLDGLAKKVYQDYLQFDESITNHHQIEFHAVELFQGKHYWRGVPQAYRIDTVFAGILNILADEGAEYYLNGINIPLLKEMYTNPYEVYPYF